MAVPADRDDQPVREFRSFTHAPIELTDWLTACDIDTVAMESTGVSWIPLYEIQAARGFTVLLANARHVKNVPGRKRDVSDCQWRPTANRRDGPYRLRAHRVPSGSDRTTRRRSRSAPPCSPGVAESTSPPCRASAPTARSG